MKVNGSTKAANDNVCQGSRAQAIMGFWEASRAWYDIDDAARGWTVEDLLNRLKPMTYFMGPLAIQAGELLERVIEDLHRRPFSGSCEVIGMQKAGAIRGRTAELIIIDECGDLMHVIDSLSSLADFTLSQHALQNNSPQE